MTEYLAVFKFRTGQTLALNSEKITLTRGKNTANNQLFFNEVPVANAGRGLPNFDQNNNWYVYNAHPTKALYDLMPDDWDKTQPSLKIIDEIHVITTPSEVQND